MQTPPGSGQPPRFYQLILQEDLLGGWSVLRQWGHLGARGTQKKAHYASLDQATQALTEHRDSQLRKGFRIMFIHGDSGA